MTLENNYWSTSKISKMAKSVFLITKIAVTYCSKMHLKHITEKRESSSSKSDGSYGNERIGNQSGSRITRSSFNDAIFGWKTKYFICSNKCSVKCRSTLSMVKSSVDLSNHSMFSKVMKAANERNDIQMLTRLNGVPNGNLVAIKAWCHRNHNCFSLYINPRNIAVQKSNPKTKMLMTKPSNSSQKISTHS